MCDLGVDVATWYLSMFFVFVVGSLLPELSLGLVLLQMKAAPVMVTTKCVLVLGKLINLLDQFNRFAPGIHATDVEDLAWTNLTHTGEPRHRK